MIIINDNDHLLKLEVGKSYYFIRYVCNLEGPSKMNQRLENFPFSIVQVQLRI